MSVAAWILVMYLDGVAIQPMKSKEACIAAAKEINPKTRIYAFCLNPETGQTLMRPF